ETFMIKGGAQRLAAEHGLMLVAPDTSPRGAGIPGEDQDWDFGTGAGFYLDATAEPWRTHYRMESYVADELYGIVTTQLPGDAGRTGIFGHSMGGHGALVLALRHPDRSEEHTSELQSRENLVCRLLLEKKKTTSLYP